ncbi:hypothetical protein AB8J00_002830, partial [Clostridium perfringens]
KKSIDEKPFNINRLFLIAKKDLNYSREEFFSSTFKEIVDLIEELNSANSLNESNPNNTSNTQQTVFIDDLGL